MRYWKCDGNGHKSFECPHCKKKVKNRRGDDYEEEGAQEAASACCGL